MQQQQRLPLEEPADLSAVLAEFRDDLSVEVLASAMTDSFPGDT